ncbi:putative elongator complex protein 1, partial [Oleoguttula sp. CCFEE 5521]
MHNLRNIAHGIIEFGEESAPLAATTWDPSNDSLICAFGPTEHDTLLTIKRFKNAYKSEDGIKIASWDAPSPNPDLPVDQVLNLHYFADAGLITLVLAGGDIVTVREDATSDQDLIEIVGSVDAGIAAAAWSPDEELLAIATNADTVLFMTRDFESIANITLTPEDFKVSDHVSVGWGKAETQFKGRGAKALRDPTVPEHVDEGNLSKFDDARARLSWRGDGQYVAMNSVLDSSPKRRIIRVFSREGVLESVSEAVNGLGAAISWKPSGQLIAAVQHLADSVDVVFFERNGLRHGEFSLRLNANELAEIRDNIDLAWNVDSTALAISLPSRVQLWTTNNYHWYLKQEIGFTGPSLSSDLVQISWHPEKSLRLSCSGGGRMRTLEYTLHVSRGPMNAPHDTGTVAVIDGCKVKLTPLRAVNVPPPMAFDEIEYSDSTLDVTFCRTGNEFALLHHSEMTFWECNYGARPISRAKHIRTVSLAALEETASSPRQLCLGPGGEAYLLSSDAGMGSSRLHLYLEHGVNSSIPLTANAMSLFARSDYERVLCLESDGTLDSLSTTCDPDGLSSIEMEPMPTQLPSSCPQTAVWQHREGCLAFGLSSNGVLHIRGAAASLTIPGCSSFVVAPTHLIYTTNQHLLKFVHLHDGELSIPLDEPEKDERCRNIERGARLITVMPSAYSLVLQMPRGNLETIYPRALVLAGIRSAVNDRNYKKAFLICRTHRVDMNILYDYAPEQFMRDVELVVKQIKKKQYIDLLLSSMSKENVADGIYKETLLMSSDVSIVNRMNGMALQAKSPTSKVNAICDAFIAVLEKDRSRYLQNVVTAHVCKQPPDLAAGLTLVSELRTAGDEAQLTQAVEHICFLADVNQLYDTALGLYDLEVTLLVAQESQKDPREYLPYLQSLQDMSNLRQRFAIDNDLKRHGKALTHLHELAVFDEVTAYTVKYKLYSTAMTLYRYDAAYTKILMALYADYLDSRSKYKEAGIAYDFVQDYTKAYEAYRSANMWRESLAAATMADLSDEDITSLARNLAEGLEESKDFVDASSIYQDYLRDPQHSLKLLCKAH